MQPYSQDEILPKLTFYFKKFYLTHSIRYVKGVDNLFDSMLCNDLIFPTWTIEKNCNLLNPFKIYSGPSLCWFNMVDLWTQNPTNVNYTVEPCYNVGHGVLGKNVLYCS